MQILEIIKNGLEYIENNLKTDITADELAKMVNYSTYYYCHLFSSVMNTSVSGYILRRRLDHALAKIASGHKAIDVVMEYGFDTYAGFYKAFKKMYGCSPRKYLSIYRVHETKKPEVANMHSEKELRKKLENWDIDKRLPISDIYIMDGSKVSGNVWKVGNEYILKTGDRVKLLKNITISKALNRQGFISSLPVLTKSGAEYLEGEEIFILTKGIIGNPLPSIDRYGEDRLFYASQYGKSLARLHKALKTAMKDVPADEVNLYENVIRWALPNVRLQNEQWNMGIDESAFDDYIEKFRILHDRLPKQLIHRDPNPSNILFSGREISGFIDFDLSEINIRLWDICYCTTGILSETEENRGKYEKWLGILKEILAGYDHESRLTDEEKASVFYVLLSIQMICVAYFESVEKYRQLAKTNRSMLTYIISQKDYITGIFK